MRSRIGWYLTLALSIAAAAEAQQLIATIPLPVRPGAAQAVPSYYALDAVRERLYVSVGYRNADGTFPAESDIVVIDGSNDTVIAAVPFPFQIFDVAFNPTTDTIYAATFQHGIQVIDAATLAVTGAITAVNESANLAIDPVANRVWATAFRAAVVYQIDGSSNTVMATHAIPGSNIFPGPIEVDAAAQRVYVSHHSGATPWPLTVLDANSGAVLAQAFDRDVHALAIDSLNQRVYAAGLNQKLQVYDTTAGAYSHLDVPVAGTGGIGGLAHDPATDRIYVTRVASGNVDAHDGPSLAALSSLDLGTDIFDVVPAPHFGKVYVGRRDTFVGNGTAGAILVLADAIAVEIDIKPRDSTNSVNLGSNGGVPVAILSTPSFDATSVEPLSVTLASAPVQLRGRGTPQAAFEDVDGDGLQDLVVHVDTTALELTETSTLAALEATTTQGVAVRGSDSVVVVP